jgi:hypothetical protein
MSFLPEHVEEAEWTDERRRATKEVMGLGIVRLMGPDNN